MNVQDLKEVLSNLKIGGKTAIVKLTGAQIGASGAAYGSGDVIGDTSPIEVELVRNDYGTAILQSVITHDLAAQNASFDIIFFDSNPTATTFTDNSAIDIADADLPKVIGVVNVVAGDYDASVDSSVATTLGQQIVLQNASGTNKVWIALISRGTPTYVADCLSLSFGVLQD